MVTSAGVEQMRHMLLRVTGHSGWGADSVLATYLAAGITVEWLVQVELLAEHAVAVGSPIGVRGLGGRSAEQATGARFLTGIILCVVDHRIPVATATAWTQVLAAKVNRLTGKPLRAVTGQALTRQDAEWSLQHHIPRLLTGHDRTEWPRVAREVAVNMVLLPRLVEVGALVRHPDFGVGAVRTIDTSTTTGVQRLTVDFPGGGSRSAPNWRR